MKITDTELSALKQLYRLEIQTKLSSGEKKDLKGIRASISPLNTSNLTEEQRLEIRKSVNHDRLK
jgi:hypothetical protein